MVSKKVIYDGHWQVQHSIIHVLYVTCVRTYNLGGGQFVLWLINAYTILNNFKVDCRRSPDEILMTTPGHTKSSVEDFKFKR